MNRRIPQTALLVAAVAAAAVTALPAQKLTGAGSTFGAPLYIRWADAFKKQTGVEINYASVGSGSGIQQFTAGTVDFGATDGPMNDQMIAAVHGNVVHIPTVLGGVVLMWNVQALGNQKLRFDGPTIADIYLGKITKWNDPAIARLNPGVKLPNQDIIVVHRSDGSGTSYIFTDYLSKVSPEWKSKVGFGVSPNWPTGLGGKGSEGVTQQVKSVDGAIGYVELIYALSNNLVFADVKNAAGNFVTPSLQTVSDAAAGAQFPANTDFRVSITNAAGAQSYPISSFTWLLVHKDMTDATKAKALKNFLEWMITPQAAQIASSLQFAPLPAKVVGLIKTRLNTLTVNGKPIM